jgi:hypothetical protein
MELDDLWLLFAISGPSFQAVKIKPIPPRTETGCGVVAMLRSPI